MKEKKFSWKDVFTNPTIVWTIGMLIGGFTAWALTISLNTTTQGYLWDGRNDVEMEYSVKNFDSKIYYLGGIDYVRFESNGWDDVKYELFTDVKPTAETMQLVFNMCLHTGMTHEDVWLTQEKHEVEVENIAFDCRYLLKSFFDVQEGQIYAIYGYDYDDDFTMTFDELDAFGEGQDGAKITIEDGTYVTAIDIEKGIYVYLNDTYEPFYIFGHNDIVRFLVPVPDL